MSASVLFGRLLYKIITAFFSVICAFTSLASPVRTEPQKAPDDFTPVVRFAVVSDVHISDNSEGVITDHSRSERLADLFKDSYEYAESCSYDRLDAVVVVGDMTGGGADVEYREFNAVCDENIKDGTELLVMLGNHEFIDYRDTDPTVAYTKYREFVNEEVDRHVTINGYHFVTCSYSDDAKTFSTKKDWLREQLDAATADTPDKPVFVFQHPQPFGTVYGSVNWGNTEVASIFPSYPQVIDFSGHSHYAPTDPRSIWQGSYTAVGTGCLAALMGNLNYISGDEDAPGESGSFWIVEADAEGNVRLKLYDVVNHCFFEDTDYYLADVSKKANHTYTWTNLKSLDTAPEFPVDAAITAEKDNDGNVILRFPDAEGYWPAESYGITVSDGFLSNAWSDTVISNYVRAVSDGMAVNIGEIPAGEYTVKITAMSPYAKTGETITGTITVQ